jgi:hypothetical protein
MRERKSNSSVNFASDPQRRHDIMAQPVGVEEAGASHASGSRDPRSPLRPFRNLGALRGKIHHRTIRDSGDTGGVAIGNRGVARVFARDADISQRDPDRTMRRLLVLSIALLGFFTIGARGEAERVDLALILAVDVSGSVDTTRFNMQRDGYAAAFRDPAVIEAISSGGHGAIAVTYVEWSGPLHQRQMIDWTVVRDAESAAAFGDAIAGTTRAFSDWTSISAAIEFCMAIFNQIPFEAERRVIDVSGDGSNNSGNPLALVRQAALARGITINGLPITSVEPDLARYYSEHVIGGPGAFSVAVADFNGFSTGILHKLVREIAGYRGDPVRLARSSEEPARGGVK